MLKNSDEVGRLLVFISLFVGVCLGMLVSSEPVDLV